jgi:hypothetical protein
MYLHVVDGAGKKPSGHRKCLRPETCWQSGSADRFRRSATLKKLKDKSLLSLY